MLIFDRVKLNEFALTNKTPQFSTLKAYKLNSQTKSESKKIYFVKKKFKKFLR